MTNTHHFDAAASRRDDLGYLVSDLTAANACLLAGSDHAIPLAEFKRSTSIHLIENLPVGECKIVTPDRTATATFPTDDAPGQTAVKPSPDSVDLSPAAYVEDAGASH